MKHTLEVITDGPYCDLKCPQLNMRGGASCDLFNETLIDVSEEKIERDYRCEAKFIDDSKPLPEGEG